MTTLTLYGTPISVYVRAVRLLLEEAGANYDLKDIGIFGENTAPEYLAKNPFGKVPTLDVDGTFLYETVAINEYLNETVANNKFSPSDPLQRAKMRQIIAIVDSYLYAPTIRSIVIQRLIVPSQGGQTDENMVKAAIEPATKAMKAIESIAVCSPYLIGSELTLADFHLIPVFVYFANTPEFETVMSQAPKLKDWWQKISQLPLVKKVCG
ncbi:glutathione S-transferase family protein [Leptolyngbya ohadii]|uniref:glutathione S-transferase family protein n=1 Tax=Leptolyngbya ohadii TaxID=1962290 RepID=UPI000B59CCAA|nr:glutathione S-transferase family protein [Leptolyngbya ohadii]